MKTLYESILNEYSSNDRDEVVNFINANYNGTKIDVSTAPDKNGMYIASYNGYVEVKNKNITKLTNGMFVWGSANGSFYCDNCQNLISLEGAPKKIKNGSFTCMQCISLKTLEGAPEEVSNDFNCVFCDSLKSLEGAPNKCGLFDGEDCGFTEGAIRKVCDVAGEIYV